MKKEAKRTRAAAKPERLYALTLRVPQSLYQRLTMLRGRDGRNHQDILRAALEKYLDSAGIPGAV